MTLFAYAVRRTIGAVIVFLLVVMLTMFAVGRVGLPLWSRSERGPFPDFVNPWYEPWGSFPGYALTGLGLGVVAALAWRLAARRR
jgi:hypothetical protein